MHTIERQLQQSVNNIQEWATRNGFKFSKSETVCMHFCHPPCGTRGRIGPTPPSCEVSKNLTE